MYLYAVIGLSLVARVASYGQYAKTDLMQTTVPAGAGVVQVGPVSARLGTNASCFLNLLTLTPINDGTAGQVFVCRGDSVVLTGSCPPVSQLNVVLAGGGCTTNINNSSIAFLGGYNNGADAYTCRWSVTDGVGPQQCCPDNTCQFLNNEPIVSEADKNLERRAVASITFVVTGVCCYS